MKFLLFVEGATERDALPEFLKRYVDPQLPQPVNIKIIRFKGVNDYLANISAQVGMNLSGKAAADVIAAIGLLDAYGAPVPPTVKTADERCAWLKAHVETRVNHRLFRQHFALHETEAWLLSDLNIFPPDARSAFPGRCNTPEQVNFDEPPAQLLDRIYRNRLRRPYRKTIDAKNLFLDLDPSIVRQKCPHFRQMVDEMVALGSAARP